MRIDFGRSREGVVAAVSHLLGAAPEAAALNQECGAGAVETLRWPGGLSLLFQGPSLRGWQVSQPGFPTATGLAPGLTRAIIGARGVDLRETTLGSEFRISGVSGLIEGEGPGAPVTLTWAGVTCFFR